MNKMKLALLVAGSLVAGASTSAFAAPGDTQGTVTFNGKLITETCSIVGDKDQVVELDAVSITTLNADKKEGGYKAFDIKVDCPDTKNEFNDVGIHFEPVGSTTPWDPATGNLKNNSTDPNAAKNVQIRIYNTTGGAQNLAPIGQVSGWISPAATGTNTFSYAGGYYATDATTAGPVTATVQYTLVYK